MNEKQLKAIKTLENTLLIAAAGTGKTTTIVNKINYLIKNNFYKENEILVISFTNESVNNLKTKINYHNIDIKTFHKLGLDIINNPNLKVAPSNILNYIIDEYFNSFAKYNYQTKIRIKRLLLNNNYDNLKQLIITFINLYKANYTNDNILNNLYLKSHFLKKDYLYIIIQIYNIYQNELNSSGFLDFNDILTKATLLINNNTLKTPYKFIIIDEFQDTSLIRFNLIQSIINQNNAKIFAVGDDYQSIYRFSGCDLNLFLNFKNYIPNLNILNLDYNYRNNQTLVNIANSFIMKNKKQISKQTICLKDNHKPIILIFYHNQKTIFSQIKPLINIPTIVLGRNNQDKINFNIEENDTIKFLTIHKSKGLEAENVILINLENKNTSLPSKIKNYSIIDLIINKDSFPYEEERRLFYVALTRTRNKIYLLVPYHNYSIFIKELIKNHYKYIDIKKY